MAGSENQQRIFHPAALWGIIGFIAILGQAIFRLAPLAYAPIEAGGLGIGHYALYAFSIVFNGYSEGYKAFQLQVAPRVVARACALAANPKWHHVLLAPFFCMALFHSTKKRLIISWSVYAGIVVLIILVRQLPQPWRGIVDAGVVVGLTWGVLAIVWQTIECMRGAELRASPELPLQ